MTRAAHLLVLVLPASLVAGCEALSDHRALQPQSSDPAPEVPPEDPPDAGPPDATVPPDSQAPPDATAPAPVSPYEMMCLHYCQTLEATNLYLCLESGSDSATCVGKIPDLAARSYQDRCVPQLVPASLCPRQCEALAPHYEAFCSGKDIGTDPLCPSSPAEHDRACRAGCQ